MKNTKRSKNETKKMNRSLKNRKDNAPSISAKCHNKRNNDFFIEDEKVNLNKKLMREIRQALLFQGDEKYHSNGAG